MLSRIRRYEGAMRVKMKQRVGMLILCFVIALVSGGCAEEETTVLPALRNRTTLHSSYDKDRNLSDEQITALLKAGFTMPTGGGQRSLDFFVVTDREPLTAMRGGNPYSQALETAPCVIVVAADNSRAYYEELQEMDAGLAAGAVLAQASEMELATCVLSISPQPQRVSSVQTALHMPESYTPILMIAVGYPMVDTYSSASVDGWDDHQIHMNSYDEK